MSPQYFDIHSHIQFPQYNEDRDAVINRMHKENVWALVVGTDRESSEKAVELVSGHDNLYATVGIHPTDVPTEKFDEEFYKELAANKKVVAIGECGLDYFRASERNGKALFSHSRASDGNMSNGSYFRAKDSSGEERQRQKEMFERHIQLALDNALPLMLHCRPSSGSMDAYKDVLDIISSYAKKHGEKLRGNVHFFVGDIHVAKQFLELGFTLSFTGVLTFASNYDEVVKYAPLEMILSETDCPFVAPVPYRGKRNEPVYVKEVVKRIAEIRHEDFEIVRTALAQNALRVFDF